MKKCPMRTVKETLIKEAYESYSISNIDFFIFEQIGISYTDYHVVYLTEDCLPNDTLPLGKYESIGGARGGILFFLQKHFY